MIAGELENLVKILLTVTQVEIEDLVQADRHEVGVDLACGRLAQHGLAAAGRAVHENTSADLLAIRLEEVFVLDGVEDFHANLLLDRLHAAHGFESLVGLFDELLQQFLAAVFAAEA